MDLSFVNISKREPKDGSPVIVKTGNDLLIPCLYINKEFVKVNFENDEFKPTCLVCAELWRYELNLESDKLNENAIAISSVKKMVLAAAKTEHNIGGLIAMLIEKLEALESN